MGSNGLTCRYHPKNFMTLKIGHTKFEVSPNCVMRVLCAIPFCPAKKVSELSFQHCLVIILVQYLKSNFLRLKNIHLSKIWQCSVCDLNGPVDFPAVRHRLHILKKPIFSPFRYFSFDFRTFYIILKLRSVRTQNFSHFPDLARFRRYLQKNTVTIEYVQQERKWQVPLVFSLIEPNWPLPYSTVSIICASTMPRAQNRAAIGSILLWRRLTLPIWVYNLSML